MFFEISKLVNVLLHPANWVFFLLLGLFFFKKAKSRYCGGAALLVFLCFSNGIFLKQAIAWWSGSITYDNVENRSFAAALVYGGAVSYTANTGQLNYNSSGDRITEAIRLYRKGIVKRLYFSGESLFREEMPQKGTLIFKDYLFDMGVAPEDVYIDPWARNTAENIKYFDKVLQGQTSPTSILVISSGWHLPRILKGMAHFGHTLVPYPVDMPGQGEIKTWRTLWPSWETMNEWQNFFHEIVGYYALNFQLKTS